MKSTTFQKPIEYNIEIEGEQWTQGDIIKGTLVAQNHDDTPCTLSQSGVSLSYGKYKKVKANSEDAFLVSDAKLFTPETVIPPKNKIQLEWSFQLDKNCHISDKMGSYYIIFGGQENKADCGKMKIEIALQTIFEQYLTTFENFFRFKVKEKKAKKDSVDIKLLPPNSREYASLDSLNCNLKFKDEIFQIEYTFKVKKLNYQSSNVKMQNSLVKKTHLLEPKDYLIYQTSFNQDKISATIAEALEDIKTISII